jgi:hypothetical protein
MTTNVLPMEVARKPPRAKPSKPPATAAVPKVSAKTARRITWQRRSAALLGTVASAMTVVSLTHIAGGVQLITHDAIPAWQAWGLAVGLDINYIAMELGGLVTATQLVRDKLHKLTRFRHGVQHGAERTGVHARRDQCVRARRRHRDGRDPAGARVLDLPRCCCPR